MWFNPFCVIFHKTWSFFLCRLEENKHTYPTEEHNRLLGDILASHNVRMRALLWVQWEQLIKTEGDKHVDWQLTIIHVHQEFDTLVFVFWLLCKVLAEHVTGGLLGVVVTCRWLAFPCTWRLLTWMRWLRQSTIHTFMVWLILAGNLRWRYMLILIRMIYIHYGCMLLLSLGDDRDVSKLVVVNSRIMKLLLYMWQMWLYRRVDTL